VFIAVLLLVAAAALFIAMRSPAGRAVSATHFKFVGFQNSSNGLFNAIFYTTDWPRDSSTGWGHEGVFYRTAQGWEAGNNYPRTLSLTVQNQTNILVTFCVPSTNVPMRTVSKLTSNAVGWRGKVNDCFYQMRVRLRPFHGRVQWLTNDITTAEPFRN